MSQFVDLQSIESKLLGHGVEFAAFISKQGRVMGSAWKEAINLSDEEKVTFFMMNSLNLAMQGDYDGNFGVVQYTVTERANSKVVSIPVPEGSIVLVTRKDTRISFLVRKVLKAIGYVQGLDCILPGREITA